MAQFPLYQTAIKELSLLQTKWKSLLDPIAANPMTNMSILQNVVLASGNNQIAHLLGQMQQGWVIVDIQGAANIYRNKAFNSTYLYLNSSAAVTVNLGVF
jgi:hypothetical protein